ncbi:Uncharacterised protein [Legionella pneumophila]|nr:Uncharacterised protein [Legionella pneumophila]
MPWQECNKVDEKIKFVTDVFGIDRFYMVGVTGIEPATPASRRRSRLFLNAFLYISMNNNSL